MAMKLSVGIRQSRTRRWVTAVLAAAAVGGLATVAPVFHGAAGASAAEPAIPDGAPLASWADNGRSGRYLLQIFDGKAPPANLHTTGTVMSDTDCEADAQGFSHCHNEIELPNGGGRLTVINTHNMHQYPCLDPGQKLVLGALDSSWVVATAAW